MKTNKRLFCELVASGLYSPINAVETVWDADDNINAKDKANELMDNTKITKLIKRIEKDIKQFSKPTKSWITYTLMCTIRDAKVLNDFTAIRGCTDQLNKLNGLYDQTSTVLDNVELNMTF